MARGEPDAALNSRRLQIGTDELGDLERAQRRVAVDQRPPARAYRLDEVLDLGQQRVALLERKLIDGDRRYAVDGAPTADTHVLVTVVDRHIGVGLEDANLALALHGDPAGGDVGDAAVGEAP